MGVSACSQAGLFFWECLAVSSAYLLAGLFAFLYRPLGVLCKFSTLVSVGFMFSEYYLPVCGFSPSLGIL